MDVQPPAGWYGDPAGRHERRYWTGSGWTEHVLSAGVPSTDLLTAALGTEFVADDHEESRPKPTEPRKRRRAMIALAATGALTVAAGIAVVLGTLASGGSSRTIRGSIVVEDEVLFGKIGASCSAPDGYDDIAEGRTVIVKDGAGATVGTSALAPGTLRLPSGVDDKSIEAGYCEFLFSVDVDDAEKYVVEVGDRGALTYSKSALESLGWKVQLTLG